VNERSIEPATPLSAPTGQVYAAGDLALLEAAFASLHEGVTVHDSTGQIVACNRAAARLFGVSVDEVIGTSNSLRSTLDVRYTDETPVTAENSSVTRVLATGEPERGCVLQYRIPGLSGARWVRANFHPLLRAGQAKPWGVVCSFVEITDAEGAEARLRDFSRQLRSVLTDESAVVYVKDRDGRYLYVNRRLGRLFGLARSQILGKTRAELLLADLTRMCDRDNVTVLDQRGVVTAEESFEHDVDQRGVVTAEETFGHDGDERIYLTVKFPLLDDADAPWAIAGVSIDITERRRAEQAREHQLVQAALYDSLTGCANRALLAEHLARALARAQRSERSVALLCFDVDNLKAVNDRFGHAAGDELLRVLAKRLERHVRRTDVVGLLDANAIISRHGGDEFVLLLSDLDDVDAALSGVIRHVDAAFGEPFEFAAQSITPSVSYGVSIYRRHGVTADALLAHADAAMYEMKRRHREQPDRP
jgi:diguanylate cyclase (GGDEF)-like protein/PAS domain S-box-containing protein